MDNEKLIEELQDKLDWYTLNAADKEFDPDAVARIVELLCILRPIPEEDVFDPEASLERFKSEHSDIVKKKRRLCFKYLPMKQAFLAGAAAFVLMLLGINLGTYATLQMNFFEYISLSGSQQRFLVTGQEPEVYLSWTELPENVLQAVHIPAMPAGINLLNIVLQANPQEFSLTASYISQTGDILSLYIQNEEAEKIAFRDTLEVAGITVYILNDTYSFNYSGCYYSIRSNLEYGVIENIILSVVQ